MALTSESVVAATTDQVSADLQGEAIVLGLEQGMYYGLDEVGSLVWQLLAEPRPVATIRDRIVAEYDVDPAICERDLLTFLDGLAEEGLIEVRDDASR